MKSIFSYFVSLLISSNSLYISDYFYNPKYEWLNIAISEHDSKKECGDINIKSNYLQYIILCGQYKGKGMIPLSKVKFTYEKGIFSAQSTENGKLFFSAMCTQKHFENIQKYIKSSN